MTRRIAVAALLALPTLAGAQTQLFSGSAACGVDAPPLEEVTVLSEFGTETIEYVCLFDTPVAFDWTHGEPIVRPGYCMEPGPSIFPTVFVLGLWPGEEGTAYLWSQDDPSGTPQVFHACPE